MGLGFGSRVGEEEEGVRKRGEGGRGGGKFAVSLQSDHFLTLFQSNHNWLPLEILGERGGGGEGEEEWGRGGGGEGR